MLSERLSIHVVSAGSIFRALADEMGMDVVEFNEYVKENPSIDKEIDMRTLKASLEGDVIIEGHLTAWMAPKADLKVYLTAPRMVRAKRIAQRDGVPEDVALMDIIKRERIHWERFKSLYGIDISDLSIFDLVVNTAVFEAEDVVKLIISALRSP